MAVSALSSLAFTLKLPVVVMPLLVTMLSLGCDAVLPSLAAITTDLSLNRGSAIGLFAFALFTGFGLGSLVFGAALRLGLNTAFWFFGVGGLVGALIAIPVFRTERVHNPHASRQADSNGMSPCPPGFGE
jgi:MFS family permease